MNYYEKYLKYKKKYLELKKKLIGGNCDPGRILRDHAEKVAPILEAWAPGTFYYIIRQIRAGESCNIFWINRNIPDSIAGTGPVGNHVDMYIDQTRYELIGLTATRNGRHVASGSVSADNPDGSARFIYQHLFR